MGSLTPIVVLLIVLFALIVIPSSAVVDDEEYIHINQMIVTFEKTDAVVRITYDLDPFAKTYIFLLGGRNLNPVFEQIFFDFDGITVTEIGQNHAVVMVKNVSRPSDEYYLHDSHELGTSVDLLTFIYPDGSTKRLEHTSSTQNTFYTGV